jgi:cell division protease FtsH
MYSKDELLAEIVSALAGRAAEQIEFGIETTGAASDIEQATRRARAMVSMYGMSDKFGMMQLENVQNKYLDGRPVLQVADQTGAELDQEVSRILRECYQKALDMLRENHSRLKEIAEFLFNKETITGEEFMQILNGYPVF